VRLEQLAALEVGTAIVLFLAVRAVVWTGLSLLNRLLMRWTWLVDLRTYAVFYQPPFWQVLLPLMMVLGLAPWLLDGVFKKFYGLQPFSLSALETHSPEASRTLKRVCQQRRYPLPKLGILPTSAPVAMTYGNLPRTARIVVSQGLLVQLSDDEIAAIYAGELGHITHWDFAVMTLVTLIAQIPYLVYWQVSAWGDRRLNAAVRATAAGVAAGSYGLYWLFHWTGRWLSRARLYYSDRFACDVTGNPNGLAQALLKITLGVAQDVQQQGYTSPLLESYDLLMPVGHRTALSLASGYPHIAAALTWDLQPGRAELAFNNAHPLMGDRLHLLNRYARHWRFAPAIELPTATASPHRSKPNRQWLQGAPFWGSLTGMTIALCLWLVGAVAGWFDYDPLSWLWRDLSLLLGCLLMGFSFGTFLRINAFFPDIRTTNLRVDPSLPELLREVDNLPIASQPVRWQGKLLGRRGIENWLAQDLMLQTPTGIVKLHYLSQLGAAGNLLLHPQNPDRLVGQPVTVTGWFRRGATPWIDVDTIQPQRGAAFRSGHPLWSTLLAGGTALWAAYVIVQGSFNPTM
jgi:Zn-dependent protease with chaperone function